MFRVNKNSGKTLLLYFIVMVFLVLIFSIIFRFSYDGKISEQNNSVIYILDENTSKQVYTTGILSIDYSDITTYSEIENEITRNISNKIVIYLALFLIMVGLVTILLYRVINLQNRKGLQIIIDKVCAIKSDRLSDLEDELVIIYSRLEKHFEESLKSYKELSAFLSHEQKNMLSLLRAKLEYKGHREYLKDLDDLSDSIEDILTLSDSDDTEMLEETDCILICAEISDSYNKVNNNIEFTFSDEDDCAILAKPIWLERAVSNLIDNAIKYGSNKKVFLSIVRIKNSVVISVKDCGLGIPKEEQSKVFDDRYRVKKLKSDGYGIGLSLVSHVCELCGGFIWFESEKDKGSSFYLSFSAYEKL